MLLQSVDRGKQTGLDQGGSDVQCEAPDHFPHQPQPP